MLNVEKLDDVHDAECSSLGASGIAWGLAESALSKCLAVGSALAEQIAFLTLASSPADQLASRPVGRLLLCGFGFASHCGFGFSRTIEAVPVGSSPKPVRLKSDPQGRSSSVAALRVRLQAGLAKQIAFRTLASSPAVQLTSRPVGQQTSSPADQQASWPAGSLWVRL